jgi:hypothetical protein
MSCRNNETRVLRALESHIWYKLMWALCVNMALKSKNKRAPKNWGSQRNLSPSTAYATKNERCGGGIGGYILVVR